LNVFPDELIGCRIKNNAYWNGRFGRGGKEKGLPNGSPNFCNFNFSY